MVRGFALCTALAAPAALACGFHEATGFDRGMLNFLYPGSMSVGTRTWMARNEGLLPREPAQDSPAAQRVFGYLRAQAALRHLKARLDTGGDSSARPSLSVVLLGPMLWSRFEPREGAPTLTIHTDGPGDAQVVAVTEAPVVAALATGALTLRDAEALGLIAFYGAEAAQRSAREWLGP
jgi:hypothetical protein